jgi:hypothetical protein
MPATVCLFVLTEQFTGSRKHREDGGPDLQRVGLYEKTKNPIQRR